MRTRRLATKAQSKRRVKWQDFYNQRQNGPTIVTRPDGSQYIVPNKPKKPR